MSAAFQSSRSRTAVRSAVSILATLALSGLLHAKPTADEFRAAWADTWHDGLLSAAQVTAMVDTLAGANYNAVVAEVRKCGDAYYDSQYEPRASNILDPLPFDPLADLVAKAHAAGMEAHAWIVTYRIWRDGWGSAPPDHVWTLHPEWAMEDWWGNILDGSYYNLDPGVPEVQDYIAKVVRDIVANYDIDGLNFDYIRYPSGYYWGYNDITRQRFFDEYGFWPPGSTSDPDWESWADYRRQQVTDLVKRCYLEIMEIDPAVKVSVDTVGWMGADPDDDYTQTRQYREVFQDARGWMEQHIVDMNLLMNYKREHEPAQQSDFRAWTDWLAGQSVLTARHAVDGQAAYLNSVSGSLAQMEYARTAGCQGGSTYSYMVTNKDGQPNSAFYNAVESNLYTHAADVPNMPWKSDPQAAILLGSVTAVGEPLDPVYRDWIYGATVSVTGPASRAERSDGTGTYGFLDLPPGTYTVGCTRTGLPAVPEVEVELTAGQVLRLDFDFSDADDDGIAAVSDCDDGDGGIWTDPGETGTVRFSADKITLTWDLPPDPGGSESALHYDTLRSGLAADFGTAYCVESDDGPDRTAVDEDLPAPGAVFHYLVRADNGCAGEGTLGTWSDGTPRSGRACP